ncbi:hypothetical protein KIN20_006585 [Parelaphostrongylus tenuis]|uniref:Uncharacterized protein n=1 Tax=Parelaphostrongylus tenuis TaxID=148309 RepID=A0AAD5MN74_PARTN|nr:hypothetical protein KIN20_006585 [Parelaphostrongylus tenuis]
MAVSYGFTTESYTVHFHHKAYLIPAFIAMAWAGISREKILQVILLISLDYFNHLHHSSRIAAISKIELDFVGLSDDDDQVLFCVGDVVSNPPPAGCTPKLLIHNHLAATVNSVNKECAMNQISTTIAGGDQMKT